MAKISKRIGWEVAKTIFFPILLFLLFLSVYAFYQIKIASGMSVQLQANLKKYLLSVLIIIIGFGIQRVIAGVSVWYKENIASKTATSLDDGLIPIVRRLLKVAVWIVVLLIILPLYGIDISALITTLGVGSLAIALAAQDTIANIISGFMIMVDRPFRVGNKVKIPSGEIVEVLEVGVRRSKFLSQDKAIVIVPNLELSKSKIVNYTYGEERNDKG